MQTIRLKPKTAISVIEIYYLLSVCLILLGILLVILFFRWWIVTAAIVGLLEIVIFANWSKLQFINFCLRHCKYPYELFSVLQQLELTDNLELQGPDGLASRPDKSQFSTKEFLEDNKLKCEIERRNKRFPFALAGIMMTSSMLIYFAQVVAFGEKPFLFVVIGLVLVFNVYFWIRTKDNNSERDRQVVLIFSEKGLQFDGLLYKWEKIQKWIVKGQTEHSYGKMNITYRKNESETTELAIDLNSVKIDRIDFMLMLTHFKAKYE